MPTVGQSSLWLVSPTRDVMPSCRLRYLLAQCYMEGSGVPEVSKVEDGSATVHQHCYCVSVLPSEHLSLPTLLLCQYCYCANTATVPTLLCANNTRCPHYSMGTLRCANIIACHRHWYEHYSVSA